VEKTDSKTSWPGILVGLLIGIESTLKHNPKIKVYVPKGFYPEGFQLLKGAEFAQCKLSNKVPHTGEVVVNESNNYSLIQQL